MENSKKIRKKPSKAKTDVKAQINNEVRQNRSIFEMDKKNFCSTYIFIILQIIHAQEKFKQAKVSTIRNLVKKLKHPEKNPKQNLAAKAERFQNVLNQIKVCSFLKFFLLLFQLNHFILSSNELYTCRFQHMLPKRLGLLALIYYKSGKNYLSDSQSTVEQLAVGYFSQYKGLNSILDAIRNKLNLDNAPDWRRLAKKLFKKKDKSIKKEKIDKKKNAFVESDNVKPNESKLENSNGNLEKSSKSANKKQKKQTESTQLDAAAPALESDESSESSATEDNADSLPPPTTVDDFFITADGSNYLSTAVANKKEDDESDDDSKGKGFVKKSNESSFFQKNNKKPVKLATVRSEAGPKRKWSDDREEKVETGKQLKVDPNLHPSWQAKQKLKPTIAEFKGKKITFD